MARKVCFACGRPLGKNPRLADTRDDQIVFVGQECAKMIRRAGDKGWQPPQRGPRLYPLNQSLSQWEIGALHRRCNGQPPLDDADSLDVQTLCELFPNITKDIQENIAAGAVISAAIVLVRQLGCSIAHARSLVEAMRASTTN